MEYNWFANNPDVTWLKEKYFSNEKQKIQLDEGDILLLPEQMNDKLYFIAVGKLAGYITNPEGEKFDIFESHANTFVGVYSFFSGTHRSYSTVIATAPTILFYITIEQRNELESNGQEFSKHFLPVIVHEIYLRQLLAQRLTIEKQGTLKKLLQAEKMATLGQMASGLAHELNNAVGVINSNTEWLSNEIEKLIIDSKREELVNFYRFCLHKGRIFSTSEIRERRKLLEDKYKFSARTAKKIAKTSLTEEQIVAHIDAIRDNEDEINYYLNIGIAFHDTLTAAKHAKHVVQSVRELGRKTNDMEDVHIDESIREALALAKNVCKHVKLELDLNIQSTFTGDKGDLVQVWLNLIKNACESMINANLKSPVLTVTSKEGKRGYSIIIQDVGPGIPKDKLEQIFHPNFTTKKTGLSFGLGLGLTIVKRIIEGYNGSILVESDKTHTLFEVKLPK